MRVLEESESPRPRAVVGTKGFTLIEMLVVVSILAVLASIGLPLAELSRKRSNEEELRRSLREIRTALDQYKRFVDAGSIQRAADASGYPANLNALVEGVPDLKSPLGAKVFILRRLPRDPFAPADIADPAETWATRSYANDPGDFRPGKDVFDVASRSNEVGLNGKPYSTW